MNFTEIGAANSRLETREPPLREPRLRGAVDSRIPDAVCLFYLVFSGPVIGAVTACCCGCLVQRTLVSITSSSATVLAQSTVLNFNYIEGKCLKGRALRHRIELKQCPFLFLLNRMRSWQHTMRPSVGANLL